MTRAAIELYRLAFGVTTIARYDSITGGVSHGDLDVRDALTRKLATGT